MIKLDILLSAKTWNLGEIFCFTRLRYQHFQIYFSVIGVHQADQNATKIPTSRVSYLTVNKRWDQVRDSTMQNVRKSQILLTKRLRNFLCCRKPSTCLNSCVHESGVLVNVSKVRVLFQKVEFPRLDLDLFGPFLFTLQCTGAN